MCDIMDSAQKKGVWMCLGFYPHSHVGTSKWRMPPIIHNHSPIYGYFKEKMMGKDSMEQAWASLRQRIQPSAEAKPALGRLGSLQDVQLWELLLFSTNHWFIMGKKAAIMGPKKKVYRLPTASSATWSAEFEESQASIRFLSNAQAVVSQLMAPCWSYNRYPLVIKHGNGPPPCAMIFPLPILPIEFWGFANQPYPALFDYRRV